MQKKGLFFFFFAIQKTRDKRVKPQIKGQPIVMQARIFSTKRFIQFQKRALICCNVGKQQKHVQPCESDAMRLSILTFVQACGIFVSPRETLRCRKTQWSRWLYLVWLNSQIRQVGVIRKVQNRLWAVFCNNSTLFYSQLVMFQAEQK